MVNLQNIFFKNKIFKDASKEQKEASLKQILEKTDNMMNKTFISIIANIQDYLIDVSKNMEEELKKDIDNMKEFEVEEYLKEIEKCVQLELDDIKDSIISQLK